MKTFATIITQTTLSTLGAALICLSASGKDMPLKGTASGTVLGASNLSTPETDGPAFLEEYAEGTCFFSYTGQAHISMDWDVSSVFNGHWVTYLLEGTFTLRSANGDTARGVFILWQEANCNDFYAEFNFREGTGRYAGLSGIVPGNGRRVGNQLAWRLDGTVSLGN